MPDASLSAAIREAYASAPVDQVVYHTLEIHHASFTQPIRVVLGKRLIEARLEASAPRNAGQVVTFTALSFNIVPPNQDTQAIPSCTIQLDNVDRAIGAAVDGANTAGGITTVIYRAFLSGELLDGPETDPGIEMTLMSVEIDAFKVTCTCGWPNLLNRSFPRGDYDLDRFPGLAP